MSHPAKPILRYSLAQAMARSTKSPAAGSKAFSLADAMRQLTVDGTRKDVSR